MASASHIGCYLWVITWVFKNILYILCIYVYDTLDCLLFYVVNNLDNQCIDVLKYRITFYGEWVASASHIGCYLWLMTWVINNILYIWCIDVYDYTLECLLFYVVNNLNNQCNDVFKYRITLYVEWLASASRISLYLRIIIFVINN